MLDNVIGLATGESFEPIPDDSVEKQRDDIDRAIHYLQETRELVGADPNKTYKGVIVITPFQRDIEGSAIQQDVEFSLNGIYTIETLGSIDMTKHHILKNNFEA